jgi:hypothetical protein
METFIICERSFITMKLLWHSYLVLSLGTGAMKLCTETGLMLVCRSSHKYNSHCKILFVCAKEN